MSKRDFIPPDFLRMQENVRIMQTHEAVVDIIHGRSVGYNLLDAFTYGLGLGNYPSEFVEYVESSDDDYNDDDDDDDDHFGSQSNRYCGFTPNFLDRGIPKTLPAIAFRSVKGVSPEEAAKNAKELVDEEEKLKMKAEKKKQKKMRQRERKRLEKIEKENADKSKKVNTASEKPAEKEYKKKNKTNNSAPVPPEPDPGPQTHEASENSDCSDEEDDQESVTEELEELDMNSCFVTNAAAIAKRKIEQKPKPDRKDKKEENLRKHGAIKTRTKEPHNQPKQTHEEKESSGETVDFVTKSLVLATMGNDYAAAGNLEMAVMYFTDAIKHNPKEFKLFGNRSFCYEKMQQYERALADADIALSLSPTWIKGLYRKGKALVGLKRYYDASLIYKEVLKLDSSCTDAAQELMRVQIMQLMDMGFTREQSSNALIIHGTVEKALEALSGLQGSIVASPVPAEEEWEFAERKQPSKVPLRTVSQNQPRPNTAVMPTPPELFPIWVGDLVPEISESEIYELFRVFGPVYSVKVLRARRCAFVNFTSKDHSEKAIREMHGYAVAGTTLVVRYPDRLHSHLGASKAAATDTAKVNKLPDECYFWRTTGCIKNNRCSYRHVPEHKGVDRAKAKF
uniref:Si:dkey-33c12.4 n=1 Tax=Astyanax mexicanus TaxID=7994 RepID=W5KUB0_ASTMX